MSVITGVCQLLRSPVKVVSRQRLSFHQQCGITGSSLSRHHALHYTPSSIFSTTLGDGRKPQLLKPAHGMIHSSNQQQNLQAAIYSRKLVWRDQRRDIAADIWDDLKQIRFSPAPALVLGFSGLIPFVAAPFYMVWNQVFLSQVVLAQTMYGACKLSFLGGVRWGFVIPERSECAGDWFNFAYSVAPSLVAWTALLVPQPMSVLLVMGGIAGSAYFDTVVKGYPPWFKGLRFTLSFGAILSLLSAFLCQYMFSAPSDKETSKVKDSDSA